MYIDILLIAIFVLAVFISYRRGLLSALSGLVTYAVALAVTYFFTGTSYVYLYENVVRGFVIDRIKSAIFNGTAEQEGNRWFDLVKEAKVISTNAEDIATYITDNFLSGTLLQGTRAVTAAALFILTSVLLGILFRMLKRITKKQGAVGKVDSTLGGILGVAKGLVLVLALCLILIYAKGYSITSEADLFLYEQVQDSYLVELVETYGADLATRWFAELPLNF